MTTQTDYEEKAGLTFPVQPTSDAKTETVGMPYEQAKRFLSGKPLRRPRRNMSSQDDREAAEAMRRLNDPSENPIPLDDIRVQLDLD